MEKLDVSNKALLLNPLCVRDKHAAAFRDDSEMYYALTREKEKLAKG